MEKLFAIIFFVFSQAILADGLELSAGQILSFRNFELDKKEQVYKAHLDYLILNDKSYFLVPERFSNKSVKIVIDNLIVKGEAFLGQTFDENTGVLQNAGNPGAYYWQKHIARAANGKNGVDYSQDDKPEYGGGDRGRDGRDGENGRSGRNSINHLVIDANISRLDKLTVFLVAQSGGHGGRGGRGQAGSDAKCDRNAGGDGGNGGAGAIGGAGGSVGNITFMWKAINPILETGSAPFGLHFVQIPGANGFPEAGGPGGNGGDEVVCELFWQKVGRRSGGTPGHVGRHGWDNIDKTKYLQLGNVGKVEVINKERSE